MNMDFHPRLEQPSKVKFYARVSSRVSFLYLKYKQQPNQTFLSDRLTSSRGQSRKPNWLAKLSSDLASCALSRSSSVQRSFFSGDVIGIMSQAPDVVNLVHPVLEATESWAGPGNEATQVVCMTEALPTTMRRDRASCVLDNSRFCVCNIVSLPCSLWSGNETTCVYVYKLINWCPMQWTAVGQCCERLSTRVNLKMLSGRRALCCASFCDKMMVSTFLRYHCSTQQL